MWSDPGEVKQAVETLLPVWAEVEIDDALELLGPGEGFRDRRVRAYAVHQLRKADDEVSRQCHVLVSWGTLAECVAVARRLTAPSRNLCCICYNWCKRSNSSHRRRNHLRRPQSVIRVT